MTISPHFIRLLTNVAVGAMAREQYIMGGTRSLNLVFRHRTTTAFKTATPGNSGKILSREPYLIRVILVVIKNFPQTSAILLEKR